MRYSMRYLMRYFMPGVEYVIEYPTEYPLKYLMERHYIQKAFTRYIEFIPIAPFLYPNPKNTQSSNHSPTTVQQSSNNCLTLAPC
jgi:hypothetical protein